MAYEEFGALTAPTDVITGLSEQHPLALAVAEATGVNTVAVEHVGYALSPQEGAMHAARVAVAHFGPQRTTADVGETLDLIDEVLQENERNK
jgi:hypothetical protein